MRRLNSALFVDFDNLFISLQNRTPEAARAFGEAPRVWLDWLEDVVEVPAHPEDETRMRSFLIRRAYASPRTIQVFRSFFARSAFQVIECPPLTAQGKNTADIQMVMDILDTVSAYPHIEEVVIFSSDSDFTPVLTRLRAHAKRSVVYVNEVTAAAYKAAADELVLEDEFAEMLVGHAAANPAMAPGHDQRGNRRWPARPGHRPEAQRRPQAPAPALAFPADAEQPGFEVPAPPARAPASSDDQLATEMAIAIREMVIGQTRPIPLREIVDRLKERLGSRVETSRFAGAGTISAFLRRTSIEGVGVSLRAPAVLHDIALVPPESLEERTTVTMEGVDPVIAELARRVGSVTNVPELAPLVYAALFQALAEELADRGYALWETTKGVRERLAARGIEVESRLISFVLRGLEYARHKFTPGDTADTLARKFRDQVFYLARGASLPLTPDDIAGVDRWIVGEEGARPAPAEAITPDEDDLDVALERALEAFGKSIDQP